MNTIFCTFLQLFLAITSVAPAVLAQQDLLEEPLLLWRFQMAPPADPFSSTDVLRGNGVFMAPDGTTAIVTTVGGTVFAYDAYTGDEKWAYAPEPAVANSIARTHSGVSFSGTGDDAFVIFSVVDNEFSQSPLTRVVALDMGGNDLWVSDALEGVASGDPLVSSDGGFVFLTHNVGVEEEMNGHFTILDVNSTGIVVLSQEFERIDQNGTSFETAAFGPPGIYHNPVRGNYGPIDAGSDGGVSKGDGNTNDMIVWGQMPKSLETPISDGYIFGFQLPNDFDGEDSMGDELSFFALGGFQRNFQVTTPPVLTNSGLSAYWGVSRSSFRGWAPKRFNRARNAVASFDRNAEIPGQPVFAAPALSSDAAEPVVFGGSASTQFVRMNFDFTEEIVIPTGGYVKAKALVDGSNRAVYYVEDNGMLHQANFDDLTDIWTYRFPNGVEGEMGMTPNSDVIIIADVRGFVTALQLS